LDEVSKTFNNTNLEGQYAMFSRSGIFFKKEESDSPENQFGKLLEGRTVIASS